jgi:hypothetical protein
MSEENTQPSQAEQEREDSPPNLEAVREEYIRGKGIPQLAREYGMVEATLYRWAREKGWKEERDRELDLMSKYRDSIRHLLREDSTTKAVAEGNLKLLLKIQGMNLAKLMRDIGSEKAPDLTAMAMADSLNKYTAMLEKLVKTDQSIKTDGVERKEVVHIQKVDMDDAVRLALEMKKAGKHITVQEAMALIAAQHAKNSETK